MEPINEKEAILLSQLRSCISDLEFSKQFLEDKYLVRWLRARNGKVSDAETMIRKHAQWLIDENIDSIFDWKNPPGWKEEYPWKITGFDLEGNPIVVEQSGRWDCKKAVDAGMKSELLRGNILKLETYSALVKHVSKDKNEISQVIAILDLEGMSLRQVNSIETLDSMIKGTRDYEANYPESMKHIFVLNTSWVVKVVWRVIRPFVSERTYSKLKFLGTDRKEWKDVLLKVIPENQLPKYYGGSLDDDKEIRVAKDGSWKYVSIHSTEDTQIEN